MAENLVDDPNVINDFEDECAQQLAVELREEYLLKVERRVKSHEVKVMHPPRPGKKLLVLDIDYTLFDHRSVAETGRELMRPFLHEFLSSAYQVNNQTARLQTRTDRISAQIFTIIKISAHCISQSVKLLPLIYYVACFHIYTVQDQNLLENTKSASSLFLKKL